MTTEHTEVSSQDNGTQARYTQHSDSETATEGTSPGVDPETGNDLQTREPDPRDPQDGDPYQEEAADSMGTSSSVPGTSEERYSGQERREAVTSPTQDDQSLGRAGA